jgi:prepilin-type N-terminal cleavage/methylation domain-containing protein
MLSPSRQARPHRNVPRTFRGRAGFTLVEILIALAVLGTMSAGAYIGFNAINYYAVSSRLYTEAQAVAQNQIDLILSKEPFDPTSLDPVTLQPNKIPAILAVGTTTVPNVFIYRDPVNGKVVVSGTMTTTITDPNMQVTYPPGTTTNLNVRKATVSVAYTFRNTNYVVSMDTLRTGDQ